MNKRNFLIYLSVAFEGKWSDIYHALSTKTYPDPDEANRVANSLSCGVITILDKEYPRYLRDSYMPPFVLYYYGDISLIDENISRIAIIGTRNPTSRGISKTKEISGALAKKHVIVSGLAKGVDGLAHQSAIEKNGKTIAVLGTAIDNCYPSENKKIYETMKNGHLILSEYPPSASYRKENFPLRNRLISHLARAVVVTEAKKKSGTMITTMFALTSNKEVMCFPSSDYNDSGCNLLIKEGAFLVENSNDVEYILKRSWES